MKDFLFDLREVCREVALFMTGVFLILLSFGFAGFVLWLLLRMVAAIINGGAH